MVLVVGSPSQVRDWPVMIVRWVYGTQTNDVIDMSCGNLAHVRLLGLSRALLRSQQTLVSRCTSVMQGQRSKQHTSKQARPCRADRFWLAQGDLKQGVHAKAPKQAACQLRCHVDEQLLRQPAKKVLYEFICKVCKADWVSARPALGACSPLLRDFMCI